MTVLAPHVHHSDPVKGSRFRGTVLPVADMAAADAAIADLWAREPEVTHHAWAVRLRDGTVYAQDDGEPSGTAGRPILARLEGGDLIDVLLVVTRWYGGTNLGTGGLVRAYGGCASETLAGATLAPWVAMARVSVRHAYGDTGAVDGVLAAIEVEADVDYGVDVVRRIHLPEREVDGLVTALRDATGGRIQCEVER